MLVSLAILFLCALVLGECCTKLKLPKLLGMLVTGIILGPFCLKLIAPSILNISAELRKIALVIILIRAGLSLNIKQLKKAGRPAVLLCFVPACFEIVGVMVGGRLLLGLSLLEGALLGSVLAAVSPAVIVPRMIHLIEKGYGEERAIPQMIMAGASVDDVFVITIFTALCSLVKGQGMSYTSFVRIPFAIIVGILAGCVVGWILYKLFTRIHIRDTVKVLIILSVCFLLSGLEESIEKVIPFSGLIGVMALGAFYYNRNYEVAGRLSAKFSKIWIGAEILLFVLVGASVDTSYLVKAGVTAILVVLIGLVFRMAGVGCCVTGTQLNKKERLFSMIAYTPKATVQAAIGATPLAMGFSCGNIILVTAIVAILLTAPLGAVGVDLTYKKLLEREE
ncbi:Na+/H+-exchanging protein [Lachnospiraceae bacterium KM106-2]|nr:Na+/H+-exchanging protein [Lachnospiraceae bacterium KM106-2]